MPLLSTVEFPDNSHCEGELIQLTAYLWGAAFPTALRLRLLLFTHETDLIRQKDDGDFPNPVALVHSSETGLKARAGTGREYDGIRSFC